jgi:hypothetical protein
MEAEPEGRGISLRPGGLVIETPVPGRGAHSLFICKTGNKAAPGGTILI